MGIMERRHFVTASGELSINLELPPTNIVDELKAWAKQQGLNFQVF